MLRLIRAEKQRQQQQQQREHLQRQEEERLEQEKARQQQQQLEQEKLRQKRLHLEQLHQQQQRLNQQRPEKHERSEPLTNGEVHSSTRHRRRVEAAPHHPREKSQRAESPPCVPQANGETHFPADRHEVGKPFSRLDREEPEPEAKVQPESGSDVITNDRKLLMDMLYANHEVASKQTESDEGSDAGPAADNEGAGDQQQQSVKAMVEKLGATGVDLASRLRDAKARATGAEMEGETAAAPAAPKKESDIMWEKWLAQQVSQFADTAFDRVALPIVSFL